MATPERVPGGWAVGKQVFRGKLAREKAYKFAASQPAPKKRAPKKKKEAAEETE